MSNEISRVIEQKGFIAYKRLGKKKDFWPLSLYFISNGATGEYVEKDFKSITQVKKWFETL